MDDRLSIESNGFCKAWPAAGRGRFLRRSADDETPLASPSTLCRLENRINRKSLMRIAKVLVDQFIASHKTPPEEITLDFDATDDAIHGNQVGRSMEQNTPERLQDFYQALFREITSSLVLRPG